VPCQLDQEQQQAQQQSQQHAQQWKHAQITVAELTHLQAALQRANAMAVQLRTALPTSPQQQQAPSPPLPPHSLEAPHSMATAGWPLPHLQLR
jgi:hypothetical protein